MCRPLLFLSVMFFTCSLMAQNIQPWVVNTSGGILQNTGIAVEWSLGEPVITTIGTEEYLVTQGFLQPHLDTIVLVTDLPEKWEVRAYPNPTDSYLIFETVGTGISTLIFFDVAGRQVLEVPFRAELDVGALPAGVYFISLFNRQRRFLSTFKIIKL